PVTGRQPALQHQVKNIEIGGADQILEFVNDKDVKSANAAVPVQQLRYCRVRQIHLPEGIIRVRGQRDAGESEQVLVKSSGSNRLALGDRLLRQPPPEKPIEAEQQDCLART